MMFLRSFLRNQSLPARMSEFGRMMMKRFFLSLGTSSSTCRDADDHLLSSTSQYMEAGTSASTAGSRDADDDADALL